MTPIVLTTWASLLIGRLPDGSRWLPGIVAIASCVAYALLMDTGRLAVSDEMRAWLPNLVFVAAAILLTRRTPNSERRLSAFP